MRLYVEKKAIFSNENLQIEAEIKDYLKITNLTKVRIISGYEIDGLTNQQLETAKYKVFADKDTNIIRESLQEDPEALIFSSRFLESQTDKKGDSVTTLLNVLFPHSSPVITSFKNFLLYGKLSQQDVQKIKAYYINPLEAKEMTLSDKLNIEFSDEIEPEITIEGFISFSEQGLQQVKSEYGISMAMTDFTFCQDYYKKEGKNPTITELKILDTYWSDHCRHSTFLTILEEIKVEENSYTSSLVKAMDSFDQNKKYLYPNGRPTCLMDIATTQMKSLKKKGIVTDLEESEEINACSIEVSGEVDGKTEDFIIMFKNETHNHPTEMEPFGGAATCVGGGIRDPLSGRAFVYGGMRITGSADPRERYDDTLDGKLPQRKITTTAADGYSSYSNEIGLAAGYLQEFYDKGFKAKRMECGALVAYNYKKNITRENGKPGDIIILLGGKTGRDGIGGATGSSKQQGEVALKHSAEVQKGNPIIERNIIRLFKKPEISKLIKKCNDFGAGGVSVAIGELSNSLNIELDKVPVKYPGLNGTEIAISESQERMAILLDANDADQFITAAENENLKATKVATVTSDNRIVLTFKGATICDLDSSFLNSGGVRQTADVLVKAPEFSLKKETNSDIKAQWLNTLGDLNVTTKKGIANQFDKTVGGQTVLYPFGGKNSETPEQGLAMKLPLEKGNTDLGTIMTVGYNPKLGDQSPFHASLYAVVESVMKVVSMGGELSTIRLSFQEYFESLKTKESWGKAYSALMGAYLVQDMLQIPAIGGKDSMSGSYKDINVPPSLISFAVAPCDCTKLVSRAFKSSDSNVYLIKTKALTDMTPDFANLKENIVVLTALIKAGKVKASSIVGTGGIASAISQMCFGNNIGFAFTATTEDLFSDNYTDIIIETTETLDFPLLGITNNDHAINYGGITIGLDKALQAWYQPLEEVFPTKFDFATEKIQPIAKPIQVKSPNTKRVPRVLMPIFAGTTGEYTLKRQFEKQGAIVTELLFKTKLVEASVKELSSAIDRSDLLSIPSGMSAGAEPESAKLISIILTSPMVAKAVNGLIERGGLVVGFGEGFKALIDSGLIQHGKVSPKTDSLLVSKNKSNKFYSGLVNVHAINKVYPWADDNATIVPVAVVDGSVYLNQQDFDQYYNNGQITSVYADQNPIGSRYGIEAMISKNAQVFGSMADYSQLEEGLYTNVFGAKTHAMFKNMVEHFSS